VVPVRSLDRAQHRDVGSDVNTDDRQLLEHPSAADGSGHPVERVRHMEVRHDVVLAVNLHCDARTGGERRLDERERCRAATDERLRRRLIGPR
jgi:hypothetical protein